MSDMTPMQVLKTCADHAEKNGGHFSPNLIRGSFEVSGASEAGVSLSNSLTDGLQLLEDKAFIGWNVVNGNKEWRLTDAGKAYLEEHSAAD